MAKPPKRKPGAQPFYERLPGRKRPPSPQTEEEETPVRKPQPRSRPLGSARPKPTGQAKPAPDRTTKPGVDRTPPPKTGQLRKPKPERTARPTDRTVEKPAYKRRKPEAETTDSPVHIKRTALSFAPMRLNKYLAQAGVCARRKADELITAGEVTVNGVVVTELGTKITPERDDIRVSGKAVARQDFVYVLLNKPKNHLTTAHDPEGRRTVLDLIRPATPLRVFPVGRLDRNTTGVLLLTNDGELAKKLAHPSGGVRKLYHVRLEKPLAEEHLQQIRKGVELEDGLAEVDNADYLEDPTRIAVTLHSGRNRVVRRIFEQLGYSVAALDRIAFGPLTKKGLRRGHYRLLEPREVGFLRML